MVTISVYLLAALLLVIAAFVIFRIVARRDYQRTGRLTPVSSFLELLVWGLYLGFPGLYNPPGWAWPWTASTPVGAAARAAGLLCVSAGPVLASGVMFWFGLRRAFGWQVNRLVQSGPYRVSRNPQLVGVALLVIGIVVLWPSWYALGWMVLFGILAHMMVLSEEEHLGAVYGEVYESYCKRTPRYLGIPR